MFSKQKTIILAIIAYFVVRVFSFYFPPETTTINTIISSTALLAIGYLLITKSEIGWQLIAAEIILGGAGNYLSIGPLALRTALLLTSLAIWKAQKLLKGELISTFRSDKTFTYISLALLLAVVIGSINGFVHGHTVKNIFVEAVPYLYLLYYFPLVELLKNINVREKLLFILYGGIFGCTIFTIATFIIYTSHLGILQDSYYHWFRDIAGGKITDLTNNYFRVVLSEHLAIIPLLIYFVFKDLITNKLLHVGLICSLFVLYAVNLTRAYLLGLVGALVLVNLFKRSWRTLRLSVATLAGIVLFFSLFHVIVSTNHTFGLEFFGVRIGSIASPNIEASSLSRMLLLPIILEKISAHPILGTGFGETITVYSPVVKQVITTTQFDWGFFQIQAELGIFGTLAWLLTLLVVTFIWIKQKNFVALAMYASIAIATLTGPVLFHVLGIIILVTIFAGTNKYALQPSP